MAVTGLLENHDGSEAHPLVGGTDREPVCGKQHPARERTFEEAMVSNIRMIRNGFHPEPYHEGFFKRPAVIIFIGLYVVVGSVVPILIVRNHYYDVLGKEESPDFWVDDARKHRIAKAYLCMIPLTFLAIPVFVPSMARVSVMPYLMILIFGLREALDEVIHEEFKVFVTRSLGHLLATLCAFTFLRTLDYLDHLLHEIMICEDELMDEKPIRKMQSILHSVGVTRTGNDTKDKFLGVKNTASISNVIYEKVWYTVLIGSRSFALVAYVLFTLVSEQTSFLLMAGLAYYAFMVVLASYKFWDQASLLIKLWLHKPFFVGDLVTIGLMGRPAGSGIDGFIEHITISYVIVRNFEMKQTYIPLAELSEAVVQNWSRRPTKPLLLRFTVGTGCSSEAVEALLKFTKDWIEKSPKVLQDGYKKCCLSSLAHGYDVKVIFSPAIGVQKTGLRQEFIFAVTKQAEQLKVPLSSEDAMSVFLPDDFAFKKMQ